MEVSTRFYAEGGCQTTFVAEGENGSRGDTRVKCVCRDMRA